VNSSLPPREPAFRVLVIEDNLDLVANLFAYLEARHFNLDAAHDGIAGFRLAIDGSYDAIILGWMLPGVEGPELLRGLRSRGVATPVLMLTARDALADKIAAFKSGADDYLTKPFCACRIGSAPGVADRTGPGSAANPASRRSGV
jgi:DNA-binding response OmpR family regulator